MRVIYGPAPPFDAHVITLVAPPHTTSIELDIAADAEQGQLDAATITRDAERCIVDLVPARRLEFVWIDGPDARRKLSLAVGGESSGDRASAVRRCLVPWSGSEVPGWHANLVVPRSAVTLECLDQDGFLLWSTSLKAGEASAVISLQGSEPRVLRSG